MAAQRSSRPSRGAQAASGQGGGPSFSLRYVRASDTRPAAYFVSDVAAYKNTTSVIHSPSYSPSPGSDVRPPDEDDDGCGGGGAGAPPPAAPGRGTQ